MEILLTYFTFFKGGNFDNTSSTGGHRFTIHFLRSVLNETFIVMIVLALYAMIILKKRNDVSHTYYYNSRLVMPLPLKVNFNTMLICRPSDTV